MDHLKKKKKKKNGTLRAETKIVYLHGLKSLLTGPVWSFIFFY